MKFDSLFHKAGGMFQSGKASVFAALSPFLIEPRFVTRIWGYQDLNPWFDYSSAKTGGEPIGEVWLTGDECAIASGSYKGASLGELFERAPDALMGKNRPANGSPLLVKVIFAREKLSVQVHPDDELAQKYGQPRGKTECWYALASEPGAEVAAGLREGVTLDEIRAGIQKGTLENSLAVLPVNEGDMILVDAGTVHAIWPGSILLEVQQNSDLTYRMYDYGRPRELHIEKSLEATRLKTRAGKVAEKKLEDRTVLIDEEYFKVERIPVNVSRTSTSLMGADETGPGLSYLFAASGSGRLASTGFEGFEIPARSIVAVPATSPIFAVQDLGGLDLIRIAPKWPATSK